MRNRRPDRCPFVPSTPRNGLVRPLFPLLLTYAVMWGAACSDGISVSSSTVNAHVLVQGTDFPPSFLVRTRGPITGKWR